jgi:hypothetical protein
MSGFDSGLAVFGVSTSFAWGETRRRMHPTEDSPSIARCVPTDLHVIHEIINQSALAYRGVIPADRWHEPYMSLAELESEIAKGVEFHGCRHQGRLVGVMGIQEVKDVTLIRHAYVRTEFRSQGIGGLLLGHLGALTSRPILIGTWTAASWAIRASHAEFIPTSHWLHQPAPSLPP